MGPLVHFNDFFIGDNTEASGKKSQEVLLGSTSESSDFQTSGNCWDISAQVQDATVTRRQDVPQATATDNRQEATTTTTSSILWAIRAGKITPTRDARYEFHTVIHLLLSNPRREALTPSHFPAEATEAQKGHVPHPRAPK